MKRKILIFIMLIAVSFQLFSLGIDSDWNNTSITDLDGALNPANLGYRNDESSAFEYYVLVNDQYNSENMDAILQNPGSTLGATFYGTNLSLSFEVENYLEDRTYDEEKDTLDYKGYSKFSLGIDWGYKISNLALGLSINAGSDMVKSDYELSTNIFAITDYFVETFFSRYQSVSSSQFFNLGFGFRYEFPNNIVIALLSDQDFDVDSSTIDFEEYGKNLCLGISGITSEYSSNGELNPTRIKLYGDLLYIGDSTKRETRVSAEFRLQLSRDIYASLYLGLEETQEALIDIFSFDAESATSYYGLSFNTGSYNLLLNCGIPVEYYNGSNDSDDNISITIKLSYQS